MMALTARGRACAEGFRSQLKFFNPAFYTANAEKEDQYTQP